MTGGGGGGGGGSRFLKQPWECQSGGGSGEDGEVVLIGGAR